MAIDSKIKLGILGSVGVVALLGFSSISSMLFEELDAKNIMVIQYLDGTLETFVEPGIKMQWFGKVTKYPRRTQYNFESKTKDNNVDESIKIRFNDGGHAQISGTVSWEMPLDKSRFIRLHKEFGSAEAIEQQLIRPSIEKSIYMTGPLMSSTESSGERRQELLQYIDDQAQNGVYSTKTIVEKVADPITGGEKTINKVNLIQDNKGLYIRSSGSSLKEYGTKLLPVNIKEIKYDPLVEKQIEQRQQATTAVQISLANARKAEQDALTAAQQGKAEAERAKWKQEVIKAEQVTKAEQELQVAELNTKAAEQKKRKDILEGEGEAEKRKLIMNADGGLEKKLTALIEINKSYADAIQHAQPGAWTPQIAMGAHDSQGVNAVTGLTQLLLAKTAKDLNMDMGVVGRDAVATEPKKRK